MHRQAKQWMAAVAVAAAVWFAGASSVLAQGAGGGGQQPPPDPPVIAYRKAMMNLNAQHTNALRAALNGGADKKVIKVHAKALEDQGKALGSLFPAGSSGPQSRAKDEIWTAKDDFAAKVKAFADATKAVDEAAEKGDNAATLTALDAMGRTCGGCHMPYRKPPTPPPAR